ncbi:MAG: hypothetical protein ABSH51_08385 [Solirubrobacteraceae bacterium]|jgi:hypothetical protein
MAYVLVLVVLAVALTVVSGPLRAARRDGASAPGVADLEAARAAKYREITDAELDMRTGKLSAEDYEDLDRTLRGEAIDILRRLDETRAGGEATIEP